MVHAQRQIVALPAEDLPPAGVLRLLDGYAPLGDGNQDRARDDEHERRDQDDQPQQTDAPGLVLLTDIEIVHYPHHGVRHAGDDAGGENQRHAVADTVFVDLLAEPHQKEAAGRQSGDSREVVQRDIGLRLESGDDQALSHEELQPHHGLDEAQADRHVAGPLGELLLAGRPFLFQFLEARHRCLE